MLGDSRGTKHVSYGYFWVRSTLFLHSMNRVANAPVCESVPGKRGCPRECPTQKSREEGVREGVAQICRKLRAKLAQNCRYFVFNPDLLFLAFLENSSSKKSQGIP